MELTWLRWALVLVLFVLLVSKLVWDIPSSPPSLNVLMLLTVLTAILSLMADVLAQAM